MPLDLPPEYQVRMLDLSAISDMSNPHFLPGPTHKLWPATDSDYKRLYPFMWFPCMMPDRSYDEACMFASHCQLCDVAYKAFGCPLPPSEVPKLALGAPRLL